MPAMIRTALPLALLVAAAASAHAGSVQLTVTGADGKPAVNAVVLLQPTAPWSPQPLPPPVVVAQKDIRFVPYVSVVPVGGHVRFVNRDSYDHHVRSLPGGPLGTVAPAAQFDVRMAAVRGGTEAQQDVKVDTPGSIVLGCHLHGSMRGHVLVSLTPWYAVTDAEGKATVANVPDGQAELRLWHPDQLVDQAAGKVQVAGTLTQTAQLNFTPKPAPGARRSSSTGGGDTYKPPY
jgi:plastocyanin